MPYCQDNRIDTLHFLISGNQWNQGKTWFKTTDDDFIRQIETENIPDAGLYEIQAKMESLLPNLITVESDDTMIIELEIEYDPCYLTEI